MVSQWTQKRRITTLAAIAVMVIGFFGFKRYGSGKGVGYDPSIVRSTMGDIEVHFSDSGELAPKDYIDIASKVSGRVIEMSVEEGSRVKKGDRLAVVQPGRTEAEKFVPFTVTSPIDGVVMRYQKQGSYQEDSRISKLGDYETGILESNTPTYMMTVADLRRLVVKMKISEMDILKLHENMAVDVTIDALPGTTFPAIVSLVSPQAEKDSNNLKNFRVEVALIKPDARLKPGMTARVDGLLESHKGVIKIPLSAVFEENGSQVVYKKNAKGKPERITVQLGLRNESDVEVQSGLKAGEELMTEKPTATNG